ncbi:MAG: hypothetical protein II876_05075 [Synergistaceae bacterium]|nr:hypothetical protein [Synergistaceae bacterium]
MLPFFKRFKQFFRLRGHAARAKQYRLIERATNFIIDLFKPARFSVVRLNIRKEG